MDVVRKDLASGVQSLEVGEGRERQGKGEGCWGYKLCWLEAGGWLVS